MRHHPRHNRLLATLPVGAFKRIAPQLELVTMDSGQVLHEPGGRLRHAYFPVTAIVSLLHTLESGASAETAIVGRDGMLGVALLTGGESMLCRALVQSAGHGYRLKARVLKQEIDRAGALLRLLLRYTQALLTQMAQAALCIRHHSVEQQLCRWLLLRRDRLPSDSMRATQELIAQMLGVRREGVTAAAAKLQRAGLILYSRGRIRVIDRKGLETAACECYLEAKRELDRLLPNRSRAGTSRAHGLSRR